MEEICQIRAWYDAIFVHVKMLENMDDDIMMFMVIVLPLVDKFMVGYGSWI
jgi:hypothetical protein